ncbi:uncharacterized protein Z520_01161 [Fonsecaea multimorphosa CBS 102226]|uniref:Uncharacterized protein n=1 Tax=Fonsecaea multimorphosa CBS 102226 TaxID=1442371 RepID=A0A0D2HL91_9EURO|nr:uncharacterized protein Z520_01161 [Fonsecaea multimorphosa CBS 102226]KIY02696.1 hypothetical protein Z520_01161 [Fonsecaea multimorphosa CBS 102226]OAL31558.1 hypothetical protein AYO22_01150 [Fonsecaea multimorphosa]
MKQEHASSPATPRRPGETVEIPLHLLRWLLNELDECARAMHGDKANVLQTTAATTTTTISGIPDIIISSNANPSLLHNPHLQSHSDDDAVHLPSTDFRPYSEMPSPGITLPGDFRISLSGAEVQKLTICALTAMRSLNARHYVLQNRFKTLEVEFARKQEASEELVTGLLDEKDSVGRTWAWDDPHGLKEKVHARIDGLVQRYLSAVRAAEEEADREGESGFNGWA